MDDFKDFKSRKLVKDLKSINMVFKIASWLGLITKS
jgi:hypothetical protein